MRTKDLNKMLIIDCVIRHKRIRLNNISRDWEEPQVSIYKCFGIEYDPQNKQYTSSREGFSYKSLNRYVAELVEDEIFIKDGDFYSINTDKLDVVNSETRRKLQDYAEIALSSGELEIYGKICSLIDGKTEITPDKIEKYNKCIKDNIHLLSGEAENIDIIRFAIKNSIEIEFSYKGKRQRGLPITILISRDGNRNYLYCERRNKLEQPYNLLYVNGIVFLAKKECVRINEYRKALIQQWDIDSTRCKVTVILYKEKDFERNCQNALSQYLECEEETTEYNVFKGEIVGINGFKTYIRENIDKCMIIEPKELQQELMNSLKMLNQQYEEL